jgi:hypothetical protein
MNSFECVIPPSFTTRCVINLSVSDFGVVGVALQLVINIGGEWRVMEQL